MKRVVVKIGSSLLTDDSAALCTSKLNTLVTAIAGLQAAQTQVIMVTSGAIAAGFTELGFATKPQKVEQKQAAAAVGQGILMHAYRQSFLRYEQRTAQILLSRKDFSERESYTNALNTMSLLVDRGVIPIINENDSVATRELTFGDNDILAALVASLVHADLVILLTDIDGLYSGNPRVDPNAEKLHEVDEVTADILAVASTHGSAVGTGGMYAKVKAAEVALSMGCPLYVGQGNGLTTDTLAAIVEGRGDGTYFGRSQAPMRRKRQWIAYHAPIDGKIVVDQGAEEALAAGKSSLLPVGVIAVEGDFSADSVVAILSANAHLIARGIVRYSSDELKEVKGMNSEKVRTITRREKIDVVNRDNLVVVLPFD